MPLELDSEELNAAEREELEAWVHARLEDAGFDLEAIRRAHEAGDERALQSVRMCLPVDVSLALEFGLEASKPMRDQIYLTQERVAEQFQIVDELQALPPVERRRFRWMQVNAQTRALLRMTAVRADRTRPSMRPQRLMRRGGTRRRRSVRTGRAKARAPGRSADPDESERPPLARPRRAVGGRCGR